MTPSKTDRFDELEEPSTMTSPARDLYESEALERAGLAWEAVRHCGSCHDDADLGYRMNGVTFADDDRDAEVCCEVAMTLNDIEGLTIRPDWYKPRPEAPR